MQQQNLGKTGLKIAPLVFGGNVFGWTADQKRSFELLDAWVDAGYNAIDTADVYSAWAPGLKGGESETILGQWFKAQPQKREQVVLITKVGLDMGNGHKGLGRAWIEQAVEDSLKRLQTDVIDLYLSHWPDPETPYAETLEAYERLLKAGKIRAIGASNLDAFQLTEALEVSAQNQLPAYGVLEPEYNLFDRDQYEGDLESICVKHQLGVISYFSLASGFLTGKYETVEAVEQSARGEFLKKYFDARGMRILKALKQLSHELNVTETEIALAWIKSRPSITAPIVSATKLDQLQTILKSGELILSHEAMKKLNEASAMTSVA